MGWPLPAGSAFALRAESDRRRVALPAFVGIPGGNTMKTMKALLAAAVLCMLPALVSAQRPYCTGMRILSMLSGFGRWMSWWMS